MPAALPSPFDRELLVFVGKGGVGKTTTASAVALRSAEAGRRTLLVTVDPAQRLEDALDVPVDHRIREVRPNLFATMLDPKQVIQEQLRQLVPDRDLTHHPFYKYVSNYLPGINELLAIGRLAELRREKDFPTMVVDTAPTGHALSFLSLPLRVRDLLRENTLLRYALRGHALYTRLARGGRVLQKLLRRGEPVPEVPEVDFEELFREISDRAGEIHDLLKDEKRTALTVVTLPERLPVEETLDLHSYMTKELQIPVAALVVNKFNPDPLADHEKAFDRFVEDAAARRGVAGAFAKADYPGELLDGLIRAARFNEVRHRMNLEHLHHLIKELPDLPRFLVGLHEEDIYGFDRLHHFHREMFDAGGRTS